MLYFRALIKLENTLYFLNEQFYGLALDFTPVIAELLREVFNRPPHRYGLHGVGVVAALKVQLPEHEPAHYSDEDLTRILHYTRSYLLDEMNAITLGVTTPETPYHYFGGDELLLFLPLPENCVDPYLRQCAIPLEAIGHFD